MQLSTSAIVGRRPGMPSAPIKPTLPNGRLLTLPPLIPLLCRPVPPPPPPNQIISDQRRRPSLVTCRGVEYSTQHAFLLQPACQSKNGERKLRLSRRRSRPGFVGVKKRREGGSRNKGEKMAGGFAGGTAGAGRAEFYEGKITWYFILACVVGSFGGSLFGYDLGVSSEYFFLPAYLLGIVEWRHQLECPAVAINGRDEISRKFEVIAEEYIPFVSKAFNVHMSTFRKYPERSDSSPRPTSPATRRASAQPKPAAAAGGAVDETEAENGRRRRRVRSCSWAGQLHRAAAATMGSIGPTSGHVLWRDLLYNIAFHQKETQRVGKPIGPMKN
ncbi:hypothetical protein EJB05_42608, partial [Eragrostis curvula]